MVIKLNAKDFSSSISEQSLQEAFDVIYSCQKRGKLLVESRSWEQLDFDVRQEAIRLFQDYQKSYVESNTKKQVRDITTEYRLMVSKTRIDYKRGRMTSRWFKFEMMDHKTYTLFDDETKLAVNLIFKGKMNSKRETLFSTGVINTARNFISQANNSYR